MLGEGLDELIPNSNANKGVSPHIDEFQRSGKRFFQNSVIENTHRLSAYMQNNLS